MGAAFSLLPVYNCRQPLDRVDDALVDLELIERARRQRGLLTRQQMGDLRLDPDWREVQPSVFAPAVLPLTWDQSVEAVRLSLEARRRASGIPWCFSGPTAARLLGLKVGDGFPLFVVVQGSSCPSMLGVEVGFARKLPAVRYVRLAPVANVAAVIVQCAAVLDRDALISLVEHAVRTRKCSLRQLAAVCGRGVSGSRALRSVLQELSADGRDRWARSLLRLLVAAGLPRPETERGVPSEAPLIYVDLCWWWLRLAVEVDDWESHASREASERDRDRDRWLMRDYGVTVLRVTPRQIRDEPQKVVRDIVAAYRRAEKRFGPSAA